MNALKSFPNLLQSVSPVADRVQQIAIGLLAFFFVLSLLADHLQGIEGKSERVSIIFRALLFFAILASYDSLFLQIEKVGSAISAEIFSETEFSAFLHDIWNGMNAAQQSLDGVWGVLKGGITTVIVTLSYMIAIVAYKILQIGKLLSLGILYTLGPLVLAGSVLPRGGGLVLGVARNVVAVACWPIVGNLMLRLLKEMGIAGYYANPEHFVPLIAANFTFAFSLMVVPTICSSLIGGGSIGSAGSVVGLSALTTALSPLSYSWMKLRDLAWNKGMSKAGSLVRRRPSQVTPEIRPGDRVAG